MAVENIIGNENFDPGIFEAAYFATWIRVDRTLNYSGERFQKDSVSVSGFTRFRVERRSIYVKKVNYVV